MQSLKLYSRIAASAVAPFAICLAFSMLSPLRADAAGAGAHLQMGERALDNYILPGADIVPELAAFRQDNELMYAFYSGCMLPDTLQDGINDDAAEFSHWFAFDKAYLEFIKERYPYPWNKEAARHVAFFLGVICHNVGDTPWHFDEGPYKALMTQARKMDGCRNLDLVGELFARTLLRLRPEIAGHFWWPYDDVVEVFKRCGIEVTMDQVVRGSEQPEREYARAGIFGPIVYPLFRYEYPWTREHFEDYFYGGIDSGASLVAMCLRYVYGDLVGWRVYQDIPIQKAVFPNERPFTPCADVTLNERYPDNSAGGEPLLELAGNGPGDRRATLLRFDVSDIPSSGQIHEARLWLYFAKRTGDAQVAPKTIEVHRVSRPWTAGAGSQDDVSGSEGKPASEGEATWTHAQQSVTPWAQPGCAGAPQDHDPDVIDALTITPSSSPGRWMAWNVTAPVRYWADNPEKNFGLLLEQAPAETPTPGILQFYSSDAFKAQPDGYGGAVVAFRPILTVH
jgi:hypothetical protein